MLAAGITCVWTCILFVKCFLALTHLFVFWLSMCIVSNTINVCVKLWNSPLFSHNFLRDFIVKNKTERTLLITILCYEFKQIFVIEAFLEKSAFKKIWKLHRAFKVSKQHEILFISILTNKSKSSSENLAELIYIYSKKI